MLFKNYVTLGAIKTNFRAIFYCTENYFYVIKSGFFENITSKYVATPWNPPGCKSVYALPIATIQSFWDVQHRYLSIGNAFLKTT